MRAITLLSERAVTPQKATCSRRARRIGGLIGRRLFLCRCGQHGEVGCPIAMAQVWSISGAISPNGGSRCTGLTIRQVNDEVAAFKIGA